MATTKNKDQKKEKTKPKDTVKARSGNQKNSATQKFLPIAEIHDNTVVLKNGGLRAVMQTTSVNFNLKSEEEQNSLIMGYQTFLNSLEFPIQILVRSKKLDIDNYVNSLETIKERQQNPLLKQQTAEYQEYIEKLIEYADIMEKKFYVVVPVDAASGTKISFIDRFMEHVMPSDSVAKLRQRQKSFKDLRRKLTQRTNQVEQALMAINIRTTELNTKQLIELFYQSYNPITSRQEKLTNLEQMSIDDYEEHHEEK